MPSLSPDAVRVGCFSSTLGIADVAHLLQGGRIDVRR